MLQSMSLNNLSNILVLSTQIVPNVIPQLPTDLVSALNMNSFKTHANRHHKENETSCLRPVTNAAQLR